MRQVKTATAFAAAGILAISLSACGAPTNESVVMSADYPAYDTLGDATGAAALVIEGEFISSTVELLYPDIVDTGDETTNPQQGVELSEADREAMAVVTTVSEVRVTEVLKGDAAVGDVIKVSQLGGTSDGVTFEDDTTTLLSSVQAPRVMLFLSDVGGGTFDLINPAQGLYSVKGDQVEPVAPESGYRDLTSIEDVREAVQREN